MRYKELRARRALYPASKTSDEHLLRRAKHALEEGPGQDARCVKAQNLYAMARIRHAGASLFTRGFMICFLVMFFIGGCLGVCMTILVSTADFRSLRADVMHHVGMRRRRHCRYGKRQNHQKAKPLFHHSHTHKIHLFLNANNQIDENGIKHNCAFAFRPRCR